MKEVRKTPQVRFPEFAGDWRKLSIRKVTQKVGSGSTPKGGSKVYRTSGVIFIRSQNVNNDILDLSDVTFICGDTHKKMKGSSVFSNDVLLNITGASIGRSCVVPEGVGHANVNQHVCIIRFNKDISPKFAQAYLSSFNGQRNIYRNQAGGGREGLNFEAVKDIQIPITGLIEQQKIADFLSAVDEKIRLLKEKQALLKQYKKGVMRKLFSQETRFKDDNGQAFPDWEETCFNEFVVSRSEIASPEENLPLASLTISNGIEAKSARYVRDFLVGDESNAYKRVYSGDFVINPMNLRFGAVAQNRIAGMIKISKYYDVFSVTEAIDARFFAIFLRSDEMMRTYHKTATGTLEEKKRVHFSEFMNFRKALPCKEEQSKMADFLQTLDKKLNAVQQQIELTQTFKKGLLQQMFV